MLGLSDGDDVGVRGGRGVLLGLGVLVGAPSGVGVLVVGNSTRNAVVGVATASVAGCVVGTAGAGSSVGPQATNMTKAIKPRTTTWWINLGGRRVAFIGPLLLSNLMILDKP